jgi:hypothetical protein
VSVRCHPRARSPAVHRIKKVGTPAARCEQSTTKKAPDHDRGDLDIERLALDAASRVSQFLKLSGGHRRAAYNAARLAIRPSMHDGGQGYVGFREASSMRRGFISTLAQFMV